MTAIRRRAPALARRQQGVVMFVALIVMVAMALAALALIRSVDTTTAVVGNLGFRQASVLPANAAVEEAVAALFEKNTADLIRAFLKAYESMGPRGHKRLKDDYNIYLEYIEQNRYAINVKENKIEYTFG